MPLLLTAEHNQEYTPQVIGEYSILSIGNILIYLYLLNFKW